MRTSLEFNVLGDTHKELVEKAEKKIRTYLDLSHAQDLASQVEVELKVEAGQKDDYIAHVHVRVK
jgi:hypothetical protein